MLILKVLLRLLRIQVLTLRVVLYLCYFPQKRQWTCEALTSPEDMSSPVTMMFNRIEKKYPDSSDNKSGFALSSEKQNSNSLFSHSPVSRNIQGHTNEKSSVGILHTLMQVLDRKFKNKLRSAGGEKSYTD